MVSKSFRRSPRIADWSVSSPNPLEQIEVAVTRMGPLGETTTPFLPAERITLPEAIAAFTINAAYVNRDESDTGSIEVGKLADLAILDRNLFDIPATQISDAKVLATLFEGKVVHSSTLVEHLTRDERPVRLEQEAVTFHDPCYLGRYAGEHASPRALLERHGAAITEPERTVVLNATGARIERAAGA